MRPAVMSNSLQLQRCWRSTARPRPTCDALATEAADDVLPATRKLLDEWPARRAALTGADRPTRESLSGTLVPKLAVPSFDDAAPLVRWLRSENLPGHFPYTAGVFPFKRENEDPARMFAGEGGPARTNRRFKLLSDGQPATRLSTAFDSVTLYGFDPGERPDIYGKVGNSGVSIATLDDMKVLYGGFDLCSPTTSVSMTINGPAPTHPGDVPQHRDRPAARCVCNDRGPRAHRRGGGGHPGDARCARCAAPCRPTSSRRTRARTRASSPPSSASG